MVDGYLLKWKGKAYKSVIRPATLYGLETVPLTFNQEAELEVVELKMLRFSMGVTRWIRSEMSTYKEQHVDSIKNKLRETR